MRAGSLLLFCILIGCATPAGVQHSKSEGQPPEVQHDGADGDGHTGSADSEVATAASLPPRVLPLHYERADDGLLGQVMVVDRMNGTDLAHSFQTVQVDGETAWKLMVQEKGDPPFGGGEFDSYLKKLLHHREAIGLVGILGPGSDHPFAILFTPFPTTGSLSPPDHSPGAAIYILDPPPAGTVGGSPPARWLGDIFAFHRMVGESFAWPQMVRERINRKDTFVLFIASAHCGSSTAELSQWRDSLSTLGQPVDFVVVQREADRALANHLTNRAFTPIVLAIKRGEVVDLQFSGSADKRAAVTDFLVRNQYVPGKRVVTRQIAVSSPTEVKRLSLQRHHPGADFRGSNLAGIHWRKATLSGANLQGVDLSGADLRDAALYHTNLRGARLDDAKLDGALFGQTVCPDGTLSDDSQDKACGGHLTPHPG